MSALCFRHRQRRDVNFIVHWLYCPWCGNLIDQENDPEGPQKELKLLQAEFEALQVKYEDLLEQVRGPDA